MKVLVRKVHTDFGMHLALFAADPEGLEVSGLGTVCLSRKRPGNCNFPLDKLQEHDSHAPPFHTIEEMNTYIARVQADIVALLEGSGASVEVMGVDLSHPSTNGHGGSEDEDNIS